jgi:hypothetical protein
MPIVLVGAILLAGAVAKSRPPAGRALAFFLTLASTLSLVRVGAFWYLLYREWSGTQSRDLILVALLLYPEGHLFPDSTVWTVPMEILFSVILIAGSSLWAGVVTLIWRLFSGERHHS